MQAMQKLWPHGVDTGLLNTSKQIEHSRWSSERKLRENGMAARRTTGDEKKDEKRCMLKGTKMLYGNGLTCTV